MSFPFYTVFVSLTNELLNIKLEKLTGVSKNHVMPPATKISTNFAVLEQSGVLNAFGKNHKRKNN